PLTSAGTTAPPRPHPPPRGAPGEYLCLLQGPAPADGRRRPAAWLGDARVLHGRVHHGRELIAARQVPRPGGAVVPPPAGDERPVVPRHQHLAGGAVRRQLADQFAGRGVVYEDRLRLVHVVRAAPGDQVLAVVREGHGLTGVGVPG